MTPPLITICISCACLVAAALPTTATFAQGGAFSAELHAAYCLGVFDQEIAGLLDPRPHRRMSPKDERLSEQGRQKLLQDDESARRRYMLYLDSIGLSVDESQSYIAIDLMAAKQRGVAEKAQCEQHLLRCASNNPPSDCVPYPPPVCTRPAQCRDPSKFLPFPFGQ
jgi:hypothetical protein